MYVVKGGGGQYPYILERYGDQTKPVFHKKTKTTKDVVTAAHVNIILVLRFAIITCGLYTELCNT